MPSRRVALIISGRRVGQAKRSPTTQRPGGTRFARPTLLSSRRVLPLPATTALLSHHPQAVARGHHGARRAGGCRRPEVRIGHVDQRRARDSSASTTAPPDRPTSRLISTLPRSIRMDNWAGGQSICTTVGITRPLSGSRRCPLATRTGQQPAAGVVQVLLQDPALRAVDDRDLGHRALPACCGWCRSAAGRWAGSTAPGAAAPDRTPPRPAPRSATPARRAASAAPGWRRTGRGGSSTSPAAGSAASRTRTVRRCCRGRIPCR